MKNKFSKSGEQLNVPDTTNKSYSATRDNNILLLNGRRRLRYTDVGEVEQTI